MPSTASGSAADDVVAYLLPNLPQTHFTIWGGETAGRVAAINPLLEPSQILQILRTVRARLLVTLSPGAPGLDLWAKCAPILNEVETLEHVLCVDPACLVEKVAPRGLSVTGPPAGPRLRRSTRPRAGCAARFPAPDRADGDIASLFHTGGTTGMPKVAPHTQANEVFLAWSVAATLSIGPGQSIFCGLPLFHVNAPLATGLAVWAAGGNVILATPGGYRTPGLLPNLWGVARPSSGVRHDGRPDGLCVAARHPLRRA